MLYVANLTRFLLYNNPMEKIPNINENTENEGKEESNVNKEFVPKDYTEAEELELLAQYEAMHPDQFPANPELRDPSLEVAKIETLFTEFESKHSLEDLNNIVEISENLRKIFLHGKDMAKEALAYSVYNLSDEDREKYNLRTTASEDLIQINSLLNSVRKISEDEYQRLYSSYKTLSNAVGFINNNKIRHS